MSDEYGQWLIQTQESTEQESQKDSLGCKLPSSLLLSQRNLDSPVHSQRSTDKTTTPEAPS